MNKFSRSILIFCLVTVTVLASGCGAVTAVPSPTGTPVPARTAINTPTSLPTETSIPIATDTQTVASPTSVPEFGWSVIFKYDFDEDYWTIGKHSYRIIANCPDTEYFGDIDTSGTFIVDENAYLMPPIAVIEFTYNYIGVKWDGYTFYPGSFRPIQKSRILFGYGRLSLEQANQAILECQVRTIIDGKTKLKLLPDNPIPRDNEFGVYRKWD